MKFYDHLLRILAIKIFKSKERFLIYSYRDVIIITAPLVMTQTFNRYGRRIKYDRMNMSMYKAYLLVRSEEERLLSAYNKKVIGVKTDWKKKLLLLANDLSAEMDFTQFLQKLIQNRKEGRFIDRHFVPLKASYTELGIDFATISIQELLALYPELSDIKIKSSEVVVGKLRKRNLNLSEKQLINEYLGLWSVNR